MADQDRMTVLTDAQREVLAPLIEACRPPRKTEHHDLRRTIEAIIWRHDNGAKWRQIPAELGPWWMAARTFGRWSNLGVWERLLEFALHGSHSGLDQVATQNSFRVQVMPIQPVDEPTDFLKPPARMIRLAHFNAPTQHELRRLHNPPKSRLSGRQQK